MFSQPLQKWSEADGLRNQEVLAKTNDKIVSFQNDQNHKYFVLSFEKKY